jgi:hypothetical protein
MGVYRGKRSQSEANILGNAVQISRPLRQRVARHTERRVGSRNIDEFCTCLRSPPAQRLTRHQDAALIRYTFPARCD